MPRISSTTTILVLALIAVLFVRFAMRSRVRHRYGIPVVLAHRCSATELEHLGDSRDVWVRYLPADQTFVNEHPMSRSDAVSAVAVEMSQRWEKAVWIAGDPRLTYGEVVANTAQLKAPVPSLVVLLTTRSQTGPVDPAAIAQLPSDQRVSIQCTPHLSRPLSN